MKTILVLILATVAASAQMVMHAAPRTDQEKIADALRSGPDFITRDATIMDWPATKGGEYRVLRQGASAWTCLPGPPPGTRMTNRDASIEFFSMAEGRDWRTAAAS